MQSVTDVISVKSAVVDGVNRIWLNVYPVLLQEQVQEAAYDTVCDRIGLAEAHIHLQHVKFEMIIAVPASTLIYTNDEQYVYAYADVKTGQRHWVEGFQPLEWDYVYQVNRIPEFGRNGRFHFHQVLTTGDIHQFQDGKIGLKASDWTGNLSLDYFRAFMRESPIQHCIAERGLNDPTATAGRRVLDFGHGQLIKHRSISDSQSRKTFTADAYRRNFRASLDRFTLAVRLFRQYIEVNPETMPDENVRELLDLMPSLGATFTNLYEYWDKGIRPEPVLNYRPQFSGKDPHSETCKAICEAMLFFYESTSHWIDENIQLGGGEVLTVLVESLQLRMWKLVAAYVRILQLLRFTGTPIYPFASST